LGLIGRRPLRRPPGRCGQTQASRSALILECVDLVLDLFDLVALFSDLRDLPLATLEPEERGLFVELLFSAARFTNSLLIATCVA